MRELDDATSFREQLAKQLVQMNIQRERLSPRWEAHSGPMTRINERIRAVVVLLETDNDNSEEASDETT